MRFYPLDEKARASKVIEFRPQLTELYSKFFFIIFIQSDIPPGKNDSSKILMTANPIPQKMIIVINCLFIMIYKYPI